MGDGYSGEIELELIIEKLSEHFLISPNDLHRGRGPWAGLTLRARALLAALLSMQSGWRCGRSAIDELAPELGTKGMSTVVRELRDRGHIVAEKINGPHGKFTWRWRVSMRPNQDQSSICAGEPTSPSGHDGDPAILPSGHDGADQAKHDVSAGRTISPSATDGQGEVLRRTCSLEVLEEDLPPTPHDAPDTTATVEHRDEGEDDEDPIAQHRETLNAAAAACAELQPGWSRTGTVEAMREAIAAGRHPEAVAAAILALARGDHGATASPNRLTYNGPWWSTPQRAEPASRPSRKCWIHGTTTDGGRCQQCDDDAREAAARRQAGEILPAEESRAKIRATLAGRRSIRMGAS